MEAFLGPSDNLEKTSRRHDSAEGVTRPVKHELCTCCYLPKRMTIVSNVFLTSHDKVPVRCRSRLLDPT